MDALEIATAIVIELQVDYEHRMREQEDRTIDYTMMGDFAPHMWLPDEYLW
jgi:hypothetical protein